MTGCEWGTVRVIDRHGEPYDRLLSEDQQAAVWAGVLHNAEGGYVEVVAGRRDAAGTLSMRARNDPAHFPIAGDTAALVALVAHHRQAGEEVFATPLARRRQRSGKAGEVLAARRCWVDLDDADGVRRLREFAHRPHLVVLSGSGGAHAYWRLARALDPHILEATNRRLAHHLGADLSCVDQARIMRIAGTHNHKANRPCGLAYVDLVAAPVDPGRLVSGLTDPHPPPPPPSAAARARQAARLRSDDAALIPPPAYFELVAGRTVPDNGGHVACPLPDHPEQMASCMVYPTAERGWRCYGCGRGGTVYDLASLMHGGPWGRDLRGRQFVEAKRRVSEQLGLTSAAPRSTARRASDHRSPTAPLSPR